MAPWAPKLDQTVLREPGPSYGLPRTSDRCSMPLFSPNPYTEFDAAAKRLARFCGWLVDQPGAPASVRLTAALRRPVPLVGRLLGVSRVARGPVPNVRGWRVQWSEARPGGGGTVVSYLVTASGRTYLIRPRGRMGRRKAVAMFSDRSGFPPQPNPVGAAHAAMIERWLRSLLGEQVDQP